MGIYARIWIEVDVDRHLTEGEQSALEALGKSCGADPDECRAYDAGLVVGWLDYYAHEEFMGAIEEALPEGVSAAICLEWTDCDDPGKNWTFVGPRADYLELEHIDKQIAVLQGQRERVKSRLPAIPANAPTPTANLLDWPIV